MQNETYFFDKKKTICTGILAQEIIGVDDILSHIGEGGNRRTVCHQYIMSVNDSEVRNQLGAGSGSFSEWRHNYGNLSAG